MSWLPPMVSTLSPAARIIPSPSSAACKAAGVGWALSNRSPAITTRSGCCSLAHSQQASHAFSMSSSRRLRPSLTALPMRLPRCWSARCKIWIGAWLLTYVKLHCGGDLTGGAGRLVWVFGDGRGGGCLLNCAGAAAFFKRVSFAAGDFKTKLHWAAL